MLTICAIGPGDWTDVAALVFGGKWAAAKNQTTLRINDDCDQGAADGPCPLSLMPLTSEPH